MGWVRVDDAFYDHEKWIKAGPLGIALWLSALAWSNRNLTDGFVPAGQIPRLVMFDGISVTTGEVPGLAAFGEDVTACLVANRLLELGVLELVDGGYQIHDYHDYQPSAAEIQAKRADVSGKRAEAGRKGAANRWQTDGKPMAQPSQTDGPNPNPNPNGSEPKGSSRGARIPDAFTVTDEMIAWVELECPTVNWRQQTAAWVDWAKSTPGQKAVKTDWGRAWKNAMRRAAAGVRT